MNNQPKSKAQVITELSTCKMQCKISKERIENLNTVQTYRIADLITFQGDLSVALTNSVTLKELFDISVKMISRIPCVDAAMVCLQKGSELTIINQHGFSPDFLDNLSHFSPNNDNLWMNNTFNDSAPNEISILNSDEFHCLFDVSLLSSDDNRWILCVAFHEIDKTGCITDKSIEAAASQIQQHAKRIEREAGIKQKLKMLEGFFNAADDALAMQDGHGRFLMVNQTVASRFNSTVQDLIGKTLFDILPADIAARREQINKKVVQTAQRIRIQDNRGLIYFDTILAPILGENGNVTAVAAYNRDITKMKEREMALRDSQEKLQTILETSPAAIGLFDAHGLISFSNENMSLLFNSEPNELEGTHYLDLVHPEERSQSRDMMTALMNGDIEQVSHERRYKRKDGSEFLGHISGRRIVRGKEGLVGLVGIIQDVTDRKNSEESLKRTLEHKEILLREIHHRVKNNLAMIKGLLRLQKRHTENPEILDVLDAAQNRIDAMSFAYEMLYASDDLEVISSMKYLRKLLHFITGSYPDSGSRIEVNTEIHDLKLDIETAVPLGFIVTELVTNCFKHAFSDGRKGRILVSFRRVAENGCELRVEDNGIGLSPIFDPEHSQSMGLNLVRIFANQLGSELSISSNNGTHVHLVFKEIPTD